MNTITVLGIDLAKEIFQVHAADARGQKVYSRAIRRGRLMEFMAQLPPCLVGMEACGSAHYWARHFREMGHDVRLIAPQFVKPFVKTNKNDAADAEGICEAVQRPSMRFVAIKEDWQQEILSVHRVRSRWVKAKVALVNEIHGIASEYGIVLSKADGKFLKELMQLVELENDSLPRMVKAIFSRMVEEIQFLNQEINAVNSVLEQLAREQESCRRLQQIPGIGPISATALVAAIGDPNQFKNGRQLSAFLGLVPKQQGSGGKTVLLGISKRGDPYLRRLLIHGARSVVQYVNPDNPCQLNQWLLEKKKTRGPNKAAVALANKNARAVWALLKTKQDYRYQYAC